MLQDDLTAALAALTTQETSTRAEVLAAIASAKTGGTVPDAIISTAIVTINAVASDLAALATEIKPAA